MKRYVLTSLLALILWPMSPAQATDAVTPPQAVGSEPHDNAAYDPWNDPWSHQRLSSQGYPQEISLQRAVDIFNQDAQRDVTGRTQPPLTADEVVAAIRAWDVKQQPMKKKFFQLYQRVAKSGVMPTGAYIFFTKGYVDFNGYDIEFWEIYMLVGLDEYPLSPSNPTFDHTIRGRVYIASRPTKGHL